MTFTELAESRYSVRSFTTEHLPDEIIKKILGAGHIAPTGLSLIHIYLKHAALVRRGT